jgi:osmotically-inducible protein OsmY
MNRIAQGRLWRLALAALAASLAAGEASAQLYKCKGPDGKVVYSDRRCEASDTVSVPGVKNRAHENEEKAAAEKAAADKEAEKLRLEAEAHLAAQRKLDAEVRKISPADPAAAPADSAAAQGPYTPTGAERERLRELEMTAGSSGAYAEQKTAAQLHMQSIRQGRESRLSSADRERRDSLMVDLSSTDAKKRAQALRDLQSIYYR